MEKYRSVQIRDDENCDWRSGYTFLTKFKGQFVVAYKDNSKVFLKPYCRLMPYIPKSEELIRVSQNNGGFSTARFIAMDGDLYVCEEQNVVGLRKTYISWKYCGGLAE